MLRGVLVGVVLLSVSALAGCAAPLQPKTPADQTAIPPLGACYLLTPAQTDQPSHAGEPVDCAKPHTSQTFATGALPKSTGAQRKAAAHGRWVYRTCSAAFAKFIGADESLAMRVQLSWAWFRPSQRGWDEGARWYRCDLLGGPDGAKSYANLPKTARGLFSEESPEQWLTCAVGSSVIGSRKVPCSEQHDWRAVTTIKLGPPDAPYPGDRISEVRTRDYCSDSVGAWMNYPLEYQFGYTWFHEAEWNAGNRRSVCWARTSQ